MTEKRVLIQDIVRNQLPFYVKEEYPLVEEFLSQYYLSQEVQGASYDLIQNIDSYIRLDNNTDLIETAILLNEVSFIDNEIFIDLSQNQSVMNGFPDSYGLIQIDDEIITYTGKTINSFTGCIRGFSGISENEQNELIFRSSTLDSHSAGTKIINLSVLFLRYFFGKIKYQLSPGFESRELTEELNESLFIKQIKDFYRSKGTDQSFDILFRSLYDEESTIIRPRDFLFRPSDSQYNIVKQLVVESVSGDPLNLVDSTIFQDPYGNIFSAYAPVTYVEKIISKSNREYYKISLDFSYNRDISVQGAVYGVFSVHPKTRVIGNVSSDFTTLDVDSTIGFPNSGELNVIYDDQTTGTIFYTEKTINQFLNCSNISGTILDKSEIDLNTFVYGRSNINQDEIISVKVRSVIENLEILDSTENLKTNDSIIISSLGSRSEDVRTKNWFYNVSPTYVINQVNLLDESTLKYEIKTVRNNNFKVGDQIKIFSSNEERTGTILEINSSNSLIIVGQGVLNERENYKIKRIILKTDYSDYSELSLINSDVQNVYEDTINSNYLIASSSLPNYNEQQLETKNYSITISGEFSGDTFKITDGIDHGFYTGDYVYYTPEKSDTDTEPEIISSLFDEGIYYVKRIDANQIKLSKSRSNIFNSIFIEIETKQVNNNKLELFNFRNKRVKSQKLLREIKKPIQDNKKYETIPDSKTGILINGVEILNYKSNDTVYYGQLESIDVISRGYDYDVINPPEILITDTIGVGASARCSVNGSLREIRIIDPGFDYVEEPIIKITGGNGSGATAKANMKLIDYQISTNVESRSELIDLVNDTIGFSTYHKFRNAERIVYFTNNQTAISGLVSNSDYYVSVKDNLTISLHKNFNDANVGINTINLISNGIGNHSFKSFDKKLVVGYIQVINNGNNYQNKERVVSGINTAFNYIEIENHRYNSGEYVKYTTTGVSISGLVNNGEYIVTKLNKNQFSLSLNDFDYSTKQYVNLLTTGSGVHRFNYPDIKVEVIGKVGISSINDETFTCKIQPIFRGEITSVDLINKGSGYGCNNILNYYREPLITLRKGQGVQLLPIVNDGKISEVLILNSGNNYNCPPDLQVIGDGLGATLTPIVKNGKLTEIKVIEGGLGYNQNTTKINAIFPGNESSFYPNVQKWRVNNFQKHLDVFTEDDGVIVEGLNDTYELQFTHLYAPRKIREVIYSKDQDGNILYGRTDLRKINNTESFSNDHSPIIGWAYDGNPIYGPYGYITKQGGSSSQMKSGYVLESKSNRPSLSDFPLGFFVEDYTYKKVTDETVLDENNGRYCLTPEFPNGTYAYFATFSQETDSSGAFERYKRPSFPYLIGNTFYSRPNEFNYLKSSNQDSIDLNQTNWSRVIDYYNFYDENETNYDYIEFPNNLNQKSLVKSVGTGSVKNIKIVDGGKNYKVNDELIFDETDTFGTGLRSKVSSVKGKDVNNINVQSISIGDVEIESVKDNNNFSLISDEPHNLKNSELVVLSGFGTVSNFLNGFYNIVVNTNVLSLASSIGNVSTTGIVTYFNVYGNISAEKIRENDILKINNEKVKVLNVDNQSSRIRVLRAVEGSTSTSHNQTDLINELSRKIVVKSNNRPDFRINYNKEIYFNPSESLGIGTIGIGTTLSFSNPGTGVTQVFVPIRSIYLPNHNLNTNDSLNYFNNTGSSISVLRSGISTTLSNNSLVYIAKINNDFIGLSTIKVGLGSTGSFVGLGTISNDNPLLYFTGIGTGTYHSFRTNYDSILGTISKNTVTVTTKEPHQLLNNDKVNVNVNPRLTENIIVKYNDNYRRVLINPKNYSLVDIDTNRNLIEIENHGFLTGQKVLYTTNSVGIVGIGLTNNQIYYVVKIDDDNIRLTQSQYESDRISPNSIGITTNCYGTLSSINPPIKVYRDSTIVFDLSDNSLSYEKQSSRYSAFELEFFNDASFNQKFESSENRKQFNVQRIGTVGVTSDAKVTLTIDSSIENNFYYKLNPIFVNDPPNEKLEINVDNEVRSYNEIQINLSEYNGEHSIVSTSSTTFSYEIKNTPESSTNSSVEYFTNSLNCNGSIANIEILDNGRNYTSLPSVLSVKTTNGKDSILEPESDNIGKLLKTRINDIGFDFPTDYTLRPSVSLPQVLKLTSFYSFDSVGISSFGRGYISPPKLLVIDGLSKEQLTEADLRYEFGKTELSIRNNTFRLSDVNPTILPIENSNGVGISSISFNNTTKDVTVSIARSFSTFDSFPFSIGDRVLIENTTVIFDEFENENTRGYNSENYNYELFTITDTDPNIGGDNGTVTYNISQFLGLNEIPGTYNQVIPTGRIIPEKYFPIFDIKRKKNVFIEGELVQSNSATGKVLGWDTKSNYLRVSSTNIFIENENVIGNISKSQGVITNNERFRSFYNLAESSVIEIGSQTNTGFLNDNLQRIQDSFYYQNFSYSIKSRISFDTWDDVVSTLNHTAGFRKFSDLQIESKILNALNVNIPVSGTTVDATNDLYGVANLNCVYDFDLVRENSVILTDRFFSDEITFSSRILTDYFESIGNRVLSIDDLSGQFNSFPRPTKFSEIYRFVLSSVTSQKIILFIRDKTLTNQRQSLIINSVNDNFTFYINQYGRVETSYDMGSFDYIVDGTDGVLLYYPTKFSVNDFDVTSLSYNIKDDMIGIGSFSFDNVVDITTSNAQILSGIQTTILGISSNFHSVKILSTISTDDDQHQYDEISITHNGTDLEYIEYGQLTTTLTSSSSGGFGTYYPYLHGTQLKLDFIPNSPVDLKSTVVNIEFSNVSSGIGTYDLKHARLIGCATSISSSATPTPNVICDYPDVYEVSYLICQVIDITNKNVQISELVAVDSDGSEILFTEYGNVETSGSIGTFGFQKNNDLIQLTFTPLPNINVVVSAYINAIRYEDDDKDRFIFEDVDIETNYGDYVGTDTDVRREFELTHDNFPIFEKEFEGYNEEIVNLENNTFLLPNHFFVSGEKLSYSISENITSAKIGIVTTDFGVGIGTTDKLPNEVYVIKLNDNEIKLAKNAEDALSSEKIELDITSVGIGSDISHKFTSTNQISKIIISLDNVIQSPVVSTSATTKLSQRTFTPDNVLYFNDTKLFFGGDLIRIDNEIMRINSVGVGSTNSINVTRPWLGTNVDGHSDGSLVVKVTADYNIIGNKIHFINAPYGNIPLSSPDNPPNEVDWTGLSKSSTFHGRTFLRSGVPNGDKETYNKNYVFDDISSNFNGINRSFRLKSNNSDVTGISNENAIILINEIFQGPELEYDYTLSESVGITSIIFNGESTSLSSDIGISQLPKGGIILSVDSVNGLGYQPLISAGGTCVVSVAGTIQSISIGNSGSGYRSGIQTNVRVGVGLSSLEEPDIQYIGTAIINKGNVVGVSITNPGIGYTTSNIPYVVFDAPLSYSNIPLIYSSSSTAGLGTQSRIDIVVGQGSSVINFNITNFGYSYKIGEILTVAIGGTIGIPTSTDYTFDEFRLTVNKTFVDKFAGWSIGDLLALDKIDRFFNGIRKVFPLSVSNEIISIFSSKGSNINIQDTLLVFVNDVLQVPGESYIFNGGSRIIFLESPKEGDTSKILFYRGTGDVDVTFKNILETVKTGDELIISYDPSIGQSPTLREEERTITSVNSIESVSTNSYFGPGNVTDELLERPVTWCRQTEDKIIDEQEVGKDRTLYEPQIYPTSYLIQSVGIGSTIIYVDNIRPFFNQLNEKVLNDDIEPDFQNKVTFISQDENRSAIGTAVVSAAGTISSVVISDGGSGYIKNPSIVFETPIGFGVTQRATGITTITSGIVTSVNITFGGIGYTSTNPPKVLIESHKFNQEINKVTEYKGDSGIIVGFGTTTNQIILDLFIPIDSYLRKSSLTGIALTISSINVGDYFIAYNTNVGSSSTVISSIGIGNSVIGVGTGYIDNVYQVNTLQIIQKNIIGIGTTYVSRVYAKTSPFILSPDSFSSKLISFDSITYKFDNNVGISTYDGDVLLLNNFGSFSWGRVLLESRSQQYQYNFYGNNGVGGISTSSLVTRTNPLKFTNYTIT